MGSSIQMYQNHPGPMFFVFQAGGLPATCGSSFWTLSGIRYSGLVGMDQLSGFKVETTTLLGPHVNLHVDSMFVGRSYAQVILNHSKGKLFLKENCSETEGDGKHRCQIIRLKTCRTSNFFVSCAYQKITLLISQEKNKTSKDGRSRSSSW